MEDPHSPRILNKIIDLRARGISFIQISEILLAEDNIHLSPTNVEKNYNKYIIRRPEMAAQDSESRKLLTKEIISTVDTLKKIYQKVMEILEDPNQRGLVTIAAAKEIREQLELQSKLLGALDNKVTNQYNFVKLTQNIVNTLEGLEKEGLITIKDRERLKRIKVEADA